MISDKKQILKRFIHKTHTSHNTAKKHKFNRRQRRIMLKTAMLFQRKKEKSAGPARVKCPVCSLFYIAPAWERCQCKVKAQEYRYNPD